MALQVPNVFARTKATYQKVNANFNYITTAINVFWNNVTQVITAAGGFVGNLTGNSNGTHTGPVAATTISASSQITSTVATGTAPFVVASTTEVANLKAATATLADTATLATEATELAGVTGGKWVEVVSRSNVSINANSTLTVNLRVAQQHNFYIMSVYGNDSITIGYRTDQSCAYIYRAYHLLTPETPDNLVVKNNTGSTITVNYKVWAWEAS